MVHALMCSVCLSGWRIVVGPLGLREGLRNWLRTMLIDYHLAPDGWVKGTERHFRRVVGREVARPQNAVETWEDHIYY